MQVKEILVQLSKSCVRAADDVRCSATSGSKLGLLAEDVANVKFKCRKQVVGVACISQPIG